MTLVGSQGNRDNAAGVQDLLNRLDHGAPEKRVHLIGDFDYKRDRD